MADDTNRAAALLVERRHLTQNIPLYIAEFSSLPAKLNGRDSIRPLRVPRQGIRLIKSRHVFIALDRVVRRILPLGESIGHLFRLLECRIRHFIRVRRSRSKRRRWW